MVASLRDLGQNEAPWHPGRTGTPWTAAISTDPVKTTPQVRLNRRPNPGWDHRSATIDAQQTPTPAPLSFVALSPRGIEEVVAAELHAIGARDIVPEVAHVRFTGTLETGYRACLWCRAASRVLLPIARFPAADPTALYEGVRSIDWDKHLDVRSTLAVDAVSTRSAINHTGFAALKTKDAIVDMLRDRHGVRPSVAPHDPDLRINVAIREDVATISIDLAGRGLHRRGWRDASGPAPLKENLAAAILLIADWPSIVAARGGLVDPMCGSGTLLVEAALMAADVAPGLGAERFGFEGWRGHDQALFARLRAEAEKRDQRPALHAARGKPGGPTLPPIVGYDTDARAINGALQNIAHAGLTGIVHVERRELPKAVAVGTNPGLVVVNPPYGQRLGLTEELPVLYRRLGDTLKRGFPHWQAQVLTGDTELAKYIGLRARRRRVLFNGRIECRLLEYPIEPPRTTTEEAADASPPAAAKTGKTEEPSLRGPVVMFANRLKKNLRKLRPWKLQSGVTCYRVYDADLPEYAFSVDIYERWVVVREHERPDSVDKVRAVARLNDALSAIEETLGVPPSDIFLRQRRRARGGTQYEKLRDSGRLREVQEGGHRFLVNMEDYFDTGLFLDHREVRALIGRLSEGGRFLNLFAYTGTATVYAARGGARETITVDLSNTYLEWAERNLQRNGFETGPQSPHRLVRADCLRWLETARGPYDLIFLDPPTFSRSKGMESTWDVQRDHVPMLRRTVELLAPGGVLIFSTNARRFRLDEAALPDLEFEDLTRTTMPLDFARSPRIHRVWKIQRKS